MPSKARKDRGLLLYQTVGIYKSDHRQRSGQANNTQVTSQIFQVRGQKLQFGAVVGGRKVVHQSNHVVSITSCPRYEPNWEESSAHCILNASHHQISLPGSLPRLTKHSTCLLTPLLAVVSLFSVALVIPLWCHALTPDSRLPINPIWIRGYMF